MKIKIDENLPASLVPALNALGHSADTVQSEGIEGSIDTIVWNACLAEGRFLITQDLDFSDARSHAPGTHAGILLIRLREPGREALFQRVMSLFETERIETWAGCMIVATEHKIRVKGS